MQQKKIILFLLILFCIGLKGLHAQTVTDIENKELFGALYNWYTVNTKKLCPKGWHVPTKTDWATLITYL